MRSSSLLGFNGDKTGEELDREGPSGQEEGVVNLSTGRGFPDLELLDHTSKKVRLSEIANNYPLIVIFYRGFW